MKGYGQAAKERFTWKPANMQDHLTMGELANKVGRTKDRLYQLEKAGVIPRPVIVKVGRMRARLYSPTDVARVVKHFDRDAKDGRASPYYGKLTKPR
jgi:hypothetical protein